MSARLGIPHYVLDYESRFHDQVMQDFADSYLQGETPIPCVRCNQTVKFTDLLAAARDLDADCLATGHYVQRLETDRGVSLARGWTLQKTNLILFATTPAQLAFLRFPLGGLSKAETVIWHGGMVWQFLKSRIAKISVLSRMAVTAMLCGACSRGG